MSPLENRIKVAAVLLAAGSVITRMFPPYPVPDPWFNNTTAIKQFRHLACMHVINYKRCMTDAVFLRAKSFSNTNAIPSERAVAILILSDPESRRYERKSCRYAARSPPQPSCKGKNCVRWFSSLPYTCPELEPTKQTYRTPAMCHSSKRGFMHCCTSVDMHMQ